MKNLHQLKKVSNMWVETKIVMDGGYQEAIIQPNETQNAIVLRVVETEDATLNARLYMSYDEALRLANELIDFVSKNRGK
jgi:hypothetical protein